MAMTERSGCRGSVQLEPETRLNDSGSRGSGPRPAPADRAACSCYVLNYGRCGLRPLAGREGGAAQGSGDPSVQRVQVGRDCLSSVLMSHLDLGT